MRKRFLTLIPVLCAVTALTAGVMYKTSGTDVKMYEPKTISFVSAAAVMAETAPVTYTPLGVPNINSSFKTYMDYRTVTDRSSAQYQLIQGCGWSDENGFMRANADTEFGIFEDYYLIALGSFYGSEMGTKYRITTDTGNVFYGILGDQKADEHTNATHQYAGNQDVVEFIVDTRKLMKNVKVMGSANVYMPLNGTIANIERIDFE